jgi:hypothetical protein
MEPAMNTALLDAVQAPLSREQIVGVENKIPELVALGAMLPIEDLIKTTHHFTKRDPKYGCGMYARELFIPKGGLIVGKIHKRPHLNIVLKGKISVLSEKGKHYFEAPCILPSNPGDKRIGYAEEDTVWVSIHITEHLGEEQLEAIEDDVIAQNYEELEAALALNDEGKQLCLGL